MSAKFFSRRLGWLSLAVAAMSLVAVLGGTASAALLAYEPFEIGLAANGDYARGRSNPGGSVYGSTLQGQNPASGGQFWTGAWGGADQVVGQQGAPSLSYPYFPKSGSRVQEAVQFFCCTFGRSGRQLGAGGLGGGLASRTVYNSFLVNFGNEGTDPPNHSDRGKQGFEFWNGGVGDGNLSSEVYFNGYSGDDLLTLKTRVANPFEDPNNPGDNFIEQKVPFAGNYDRADLSTVNGGTHLVVLKFEFNLGDFDPNVALADPLDDDRVTVYLDPTSSNEGDWVPEAVLSVATSNLRITHQSAYTHFTFSGGGHVPGGGDEIRWGDTFGDVTPFLAVPEPTALTLAGLSIAGMLLSRRRK